MSRVWRRVAEVEEVDVLLGAHGRRGWDESFVHPAAHDGVGAGVDVDGEGGEVVLVGGDEAVLAVVLEGDIAGFAFPGAVLRSGVGWVDGHTLVVRGIHLDLGRDLPGGRGLGRRRGFGGCRGLGVHGAVPETDGPVGRVDRSTRADEDPEADEDRPESAGCCRCGCGSHGSSAVAVRN